MNVGWMLFSCACRNCKAAVACDVRAHSFSPRTVEAGWRTGWQLGWRAKPQQKPSAACLLLLWDSPCPIFPFGCCLQHWGSHSTHVASPVAREREAGADGVEGDPVNPFANLSLLTVWEKRIPEEKADCTDYIRQYMNIKSGERF